MSEISDLLAGIKLPDFQPDPYVNKTQDVLFPLGENLVKGVVPEYYKGIGETGGKPFEDLLAMITRDTTTAVNENLAKRGVTRGGIGASVISKQVGDTATNLRWNDFMRALQGKQWLFGTGIDTLRDVGNRGISNQGQVNQFAISRAGLDLNRANAMANEYWMNKDYELKQDAVDSSLWGQIIQGGLGAAGMFAGMAYNPYKAVSTATNTLGSAGGGSGILNWKNTGVDEYLNPEFISYRGGYNPVSFLGAYNA